MTTLKEEIEEIKKTIEQCELKAENLKKYIKEIEKLKEEEEKGDIHIFETTDSPSIQMVIFAASFQWMDVYYRSGKQFDLNIDCYSYYFKKLRYIDDGPTLRKWYANMKKRSCHI